MARAPRAIIPPGKEHEYIRDANGNAVHVAYGEDAAMDGIVLPTGKHHQVGGGSHGFSIDDMDIPQNIIAYNESGQRTITQLTRRELAAGSAAITTSRLAGTTPEIIQRHEEEAETAFKRAAALKAKGGLAIAAMLQKASSAAYNPFEGGLMARAKTKKTKAKKKRRTTSRRVVESEGMPIAPEGQEQPKEKFREDEVEMPAPALVKITGDFGTVSANFTGVFRDGMCLVLYTDTRQLPSGYVLPERDDPMPLTVQHEQHVVECIWAGIQFTMPNVPVTFIVLLVAEEEHDDGEGRQGSSGFDDM